MGAQLLHRRGHAAQQAPARDRRQHQVHIGQLFDDFEAAGGLAGDTAESFRTGKVVEWAAELTSRTIADGLRTQSVGQRNFAHIQAFVDGIVTVTEAEIRAAMRAIVATARLVPEPSGAVAAAALLFHAAELPAYRKAVAVVSGGNVDPKQLAEVLSEA